MIFKVAIQESMKMLAKDDKTIFVGYNVRYGNKAAGTLNGISESQLLETPVAENLMLGLAIGLSIEGFKPIVYFERFDFILNALDAIVNHLDKIKELSNGEYEPKVIIRAVVGRKQKPFFAGLTHVQDFTESMKRLVAFPVIKPRSSKELIEVYQKAYKAKESYLIVEEMDNYEHDI